MKIIIYKNEVKSLIHAIREVYGRGWYGRLQLIDIITDCGYSRHVSYIIYKMCKRYKLINEDGGIVFIY